jgi:protein-S-isoprenylcysteine O-methyltransferase Ste14
MIAGLVLMISLLLVLMIAAIIIRAIIRKQKIIGRPPVPVFYFILAKTFVLVNLVFLLMKGLNINVNGILRLPMFIDFIALLLLIAGFLILFLSTLQLKNDLIFGLSNSESHRLQTKGVYSISRHPFYLGFIFILFSSCLFIPHIVNIAAFSGAWLIHHIIMKKEEQFLISQYGEEYIQYAKKVNRYITI